MLNKGSFSLSKESLDKLCSPEFREVLDYVKEMRLTHYYLGYIELTPSIIIIGIINFMENMLLKESYII